MEKKAFQDYYPDDLAQCYGCGRLNDHGYQLKSYWEGDEAVARFMPEPYHTAVPGYVYGGLIASLIDCHSTGTASAAKHRAENRELGTDPPLRFLTASLQVNYLKPTPVNHEIVLRATPREIKDRKVVVEVRLYSGDDLCATGEVITVQMPEGLKPGRQPDQEG